MFCNNVNISWLKNRYEVSNRKYVCHVPVIPARGRKA
ncbi:predicted protein [Botrytis cinerea T4]|uniref:Uncharacterized protein n=1 Tax=Botryotinia fuckeliana (strain T4) TaxID=999810 RepID=G2YFA4_BOTF4|nr:predicted protein [Botrytis cinerea T4]